MSLARAVRRVWLIIKAYVRSRKLQYQKSSTLYMVTKITRAKVLQSRHTSSSATNTIERHVEQGKGES